MRIIDPYKFVHDPLWDQVLLLTSTLAGQDVDSSSYGREIISVGGTGYSSADPLFGGPVYDLSLTTHRVTLTSDAFLGELMYVSEWTDEMWIKPVSPGASNEFFRMGSASIYGAYQTGYDFGYGVVSLDGGSYSLGWATLNPAIYNHLVIQRNNTTDPTWARMEIGLNGVKIGQSSTFSKTGTMPSAAPSSATGFGHLFGYGTIGPIMKVNERRITTAKRYDMDGGTYSVPTGPFPIG